MDEQGAQNRWDNSWILKPGFSVFLLGTKNPLPFASSMWVRKRAWERRSARKSEPGEPLQGPGRWHCLPSCVGRLQTWRTAWELRLREELQRCGWKQIPGLWNERRQSQFCCYSLCCLSSWGACFQSWEALTIWQNDSARSASSLSLLPLLLLQRDYRGLEVGRGRLVQRDSEQSLVDFLTEQIHSRGASTPLWRSPTLAPHDAVFGRAERLSKVLWIGYLRHIRPNRWAGL